MNTHELQPAQPHRFEEPAAEQISLAHVLGILRAYRSSITITLVAAIVGYAILALALYLLGPATEVTNLPFRVVFEGADANRYPNGLDFNSTEITATPVMQKVYVANGLDRFMKFGDLKSSIFVVEQNKDLERLALEYNAKLTDPKLSPFDRDRIEKEYDLRKGNIRRTDYALTFVANEHLKTVPRVLRGQILRSVLDTWGNEAMNEKGAGRYRLPVVSRNILEPQNRDEAQDFIITADILRTKANRIISSIDQMLLVPGAEVLATGNERITLPEIRANLEDTRRFRLEPLMATIRAHRVSKNYAAAIEFLQSQLDSSRRWRDQEAARVDTLQRSLDLYMQRGTSASKTSDTAGNRTALPSGGNQVIPQVDKSFLDQLSDLVAQKRDVDFRQRLVDNVNNIAITQLLPAQNEVAYYESLVQAMKTVSSTSSASPQIEESVRAEYQRASQEIYRSVDQVSEIYRIMSRNLNPGLVVYTLTDPAGESLARAYSLRRLLAYGVLLLLLLVPAVLFAALLHNRVREEEAVETRQRLATAE